MKTIITWAPPVIVSLLLHAALIMLVKFKISDDDPEKNSAKTITVELIGQNPINTSNLLTYKPNLAKAVRQLQEPIVEVSPIEISSKSTESSKPQVTPAPTNDFQSSDYIQESIQSELAVQPLSKITRPPGFLRKVEPVYPSSEQRAGSQASVLVEVTIDDKGKVVNIRVVKSAGINFDTAVIDALKKSLFAPAYIDTEPAAVKVLVPFRFNLK
jgi:protein TonB